MNKKEILKRLEAGESPVDISVDKYRQLYCKVMEDEKITVEDDVCSDTCALCLSCNVNCNKCSLADNGDKCGLSDSPWKKLTRLLRQKNEYNEPVTKRQILDAIDDMIKALKESKKFENEDIKNMSDEELEKYEKSLDKTIEEIEEQKYIKEEQACGLKVGDTVKVTQEAEYKDRGWQNAWVDQMKVGYVGKIVSIESDDDSAQGINVKVDEESETFGYPYFALEKIEPEEEQKYWTGNMKVGYVGKITSICSDIESAQGIKIKEVELNVEILNDAEKWINSTFTVDEVKKLMERISETNVYYYYLYGNIIYRIKKE